MTLAPLLMVGHTGFEPVTSGSGGPVLYPTELMPQSNNSQLGNGAPAFKFYRRVSQPLGLTRPARYKVRGPQVQWRAVR